MKYLILVLAFFSFPAIATAENISVTPASWDFGVVNVGDSPTRDFVILSEGPTPLTIDSMTFDDPAMPFSVSSVVINRHDSPPEDLTWPLRTMVLLPGEFLDLGITYSPTIVGEHSTNLNIRGDAVPPDNDLDVSLTGEAIVPEPNMLCLLSTIAAGGIAATRWRRQKSRIGAH